MATVLKTTFQLKRGTSDRWAEVNPVLAAGEPGFELDTLKLKIGNGLLPYLDLPYINEDQFILSPDESSLALDQEGNLTIFGFENASINQIPMKDENGKIIWMNLSPVATSGLIEDLNQNAPIEFYGGSALDVMEV